MTPLRLAIPMLAMAMIGGPVRAADAEPTPAVTAQVPGESYQPTATIDPTSLSLVIWRNAPVLAQARAQVGQARAGVKRSKLLPNPVFDFGWGTIPFGQLNPTPFPYQHPLAHVPNYQFQLSELVELGKRGHRQRSARESLTASGYDVYAQLTGQYFAALGELGVIAATQLRISELDELLEDAAQLTSLQRARVAKGDVAALDAERAELEETKLRTTRDEEVASLTDALGACSIIVGVRCDAFTSVDDAEVFLAQRLPLDGDKLAERPDLKSLDHQRLSALAARDLARNKAIPDPTFRVGYTRDQFTISGNQLNSVFMGVSFPITIADHGQADVMEADAMQNSAAEARARLESEARTAIARLDAQRVMVAERRTRMREKTLPQARGIVHDLDAVIARGGASLQDLLLARRTLGELVLDAAELDRMAFNLELELAQMRGWAPPPPDALNNELAN